MTNFVELERQLEEARFCLREGKGTAALQALTTVVASLAIELRNHLQTKPAPPQTFDK